MLIFCKFYISHEFVIAIKFWTWDEIIETDFSKQKYSHDMWENHCKSQINEQTSTRTEALYYSRFFQRYSLCPLGHLYLIRITFSLTIAGTSIATTVVRIVIIVIIRV